MPVLEPLVVALGKRPRADERHLAAEDVHSCGSSSSEKRRRKRPTGVTRGSSLDLEERAAGLVVLLELRLRSSASTYIVRNFRQANGLAADPGPQRAVEDRPARGQLDGERAEREHRAEEDQQQRRADEVERALDDEVDSLEDRRARARTAAASGRARTRRGRSGSPSSTARRARARHGRGSGRRAPAASVLREVRVGDDHLVDAFALDECSLELVQRAEELIPLSGRGVSEMKPTASIGGVARSAWATASMWSPRPDQHRAAAIAGGAQDHAASAARRPSAARRRSNEREQQRAVEDVVAREVLAGLGHGVEERDDHRPGRARRRCRAKPGRAARSA